MIDGPLPQTNLQRRAGAFHFWNGDPPPPEFTHWTPEGTIIIRAKTPGIASDVLWRPRQAAVAQVLGGDDSNPYAVAMNLRRGKYDGDAGFAISELTPEQLSEWNNLGG